MPSPAFNKFQERILEVKRLLSLCAPIDADYRIQKENVARDGALLRGAHVLLCSHLEGFFEDLVADLIDVYDKVATQVDKVPEELRSVQVLGAPSQWDNKDPQKRWSIVLGCAENPLIKGSGAKPPGCMDAGIHIDGFSNPSTTDVEYLFKTVGIPNVWDEFHKHEPDIIYKNSVDAIVNRRNQIAHGKADASLTLIDATTYVGRTERIAEIFELIVTTSLAAQLSDANCWLSLEQEIQRAAQSPEASASES